MSIFGVLFTLVIGALLFWVPMRWAAVPLLIGAAYMPNGQQIEIGPFHFTVVRILVAMGFVRVIMRGERIAGGFNSLDKLIILWAIWLICSSAFHDADVLTTRLGTAFTEVGAYFLFRVFLQSSDDIRRVFQSACIIFVPLAAAMLLERVNGKNYFALLGGISEGVLFRGGHFRARGPFQHPILAGTVGAVCLPMALYLWRQERKLALVGLAATGGLIVASSSSGPIMTAFSILGAMALWKAREHLRVIRWLVLLIIAVLALVMSDPVYFLIARIDITGGSTGWYRAALIRSAIEHLDQWWLVGTDLTRGWTHVSIGGSHSDITNHYIQMGVSGGLPLMLLFMGVLVAGFAGVGRALRSSWDAPFEYQFMIWTLGAILFGHATTFLSVSYFDQSAVFLYLVLAMIGSICSASFVAPVTIESPVCSYPVQ